MPKIHPTADVQTKNIGEGTSVWQFCVILPGAVIGKNCNINFNVLIENEVTIGDNVTIKPGVQVWDGVTIENNVHLGPNVTFTNDFVPRSKQQFELGKTVIKEGASIGANSTVLPGLTVGKCALIGAGSVVTKNIPPYTVWYGNPAKHRGYIDEKKIMISLDLKDDKGNQYKLVDNKPVLK